MQPDETVLLMKTYGIGLSGPRKRANIEQEYELLGNVDKSALSFRHKKVDNL